MDIDWSGEKDSKVKVKVTNTGDVAAKHAVQLYVSLPYTDMDRGHGIEKSAIQMIGYAKTGENKEDSFEEVELLEPGKDTDVEITFNVQDFYSYDKTYSHDGVEGAWMIEAGDYYFATGNGAHDAVNAVLAEMGQDVETTGAVAVEKLDADEYLTSSGDETVMNRLENADLNNTGALDVTYLSRNDWFGTFPKTVDSLTATADMITQLRNETYNLEAELAEYEGPESFTYGADNGIRAVQLRGFQIGIREGNISGLMSAFNRIGCTHVAASKDLMNGILRGEWGWKGFMMTDSVKSNQYFLPRETAVAGNDQMLGGSNNAKIWNLSTAEVEKDIVLQSCLRESYHRKLYAYANSALLNGIDENTATGGGQVWWKTMLQIATIACAVGFLAFGFLFVKKEREERGQ